MTQATEPRSRRARQARDRKVLTPLEQIRVPAQGVTGAWAYYLRPDGATIMDALILYPNGGVPDIPNNPRLAARHGTNAPYYRERQKRKGFEYLGQTLTEEGMKKLVQTIEENRPEEILWTMDQIDECERIIENTDRPEERDRQRVRRDALRTRLNYLKNELDPVKMTEELNEIARAQQLANVDPNVLRVMRAMIGEVNANMAAAIAKFQAGKDSAGIDPDTGDVAPRRPGRPRKPVDEGTMEGDPRFIDSV